MVDEDNRPRTVQAASGNGNNWLELNDSGGSQHQTLGIERSITTQAGANYTLNFDVAGRMGYDSDVTKIAVYVDGVKLASLSPQSGNLALAWNSASYSFTGSGGNQTIRIVTEATERIYAGRGTMLDDIALTETINLGLGTEDSSIQLPNISASLNDTDGSETLVLTALGLPVGTTLSDGNRTFTTTVD